MQVSDLAQNNQLPKAIRQADDDPFNFRKLNSLLKELTETEGKVLQMMIASKDEELLALLQVLSSDEIAENVLTLVRRKMQEESKEDTTDSPGEADSPDAFTKALATIGGNPKDLVASSAKTLLKLLQTLKKKPESQKSRRHRVDQIVVRKYVMEVPGALDFLKVVGFCETQTEKGIKYLEIQQSAVDPALIDEASLLLETSMREGFKTAAAPEAAAEKKMCVGGCGFFGDEAQESYCSKCFQNKTRGNKAAEPPAQPEKCIKKCGFFGAKQFNGMCSVCYRKSKAEKPPVHWRQKLQKALLKIKAVRAFLKAPRLLQKNKKRCWQCKRKVGFLGIECKCGFVFCGNHRYAEEHKCTYDHRGSHKMKLRKENQQVIASHFEKI